MITKPVQFDLIFLKIWRNDNQNELVFFLINPCFFINVCTLDAQKQFKVVLSVFRIDHFNQMCIQGWDPPGSVKYLDPGSLGNF